MQVSILFMAAQCLSIQNFDCSCGKSFGQSSSNLCYYGCGGIKCGIKYWSNAVYTAYSGGKFRVILDYSKLQLNTVLHLVSFGSILNSLA